jgi:hypothetical protein
MPKTERLAAKVLPAHKDALEQMARSEDTSEAAIIRRLIRAEAQRRGLWPVTRDQAPDAPAEVQA